MSLSNTMTNQIKISWLCSNFPLLNFKDVYIHHSSFLPSHNEQESINYRLLIQSTLDVKLLLSFSFSNSSFSIIVDSWRTGKVISNICYRVPITYYRECILCSLWGVQLQWRHHLVGHHSVRWFYLVAHILEC